MAELEEGPRTIESLAETPEAQELLDVLAAIVERLLAEESTWARAVGIQREEVDS